MNPSITATWATEVRSPPATSTLVSCVIVKTKTRSKKSSSVETRVLRSRAASDIQGSSPMRKTGIRGRRFRSRKSVSRYPARGAIEVPQEPGGRGAAGQTAAPRAGSAEREGDGDRRGRLLLARDDRSGRVRRLRSGPVHRLGRGGRALDDRRDRAE